MANDAGETNAHSKATAVAQRRNKRKIKKPVAELKSPAKQLIEVLGRRLVVWLAIGSLLGAITVCLLCIVSPSITIDQSARFFVCLLAAFFFAVFVFTLFPANYKIDLTSKISIPLVLVGPAALWIGLLMLFLHLLPEQRNFGKIYKPASDNEPLIYSTTWVLGWKPAPPVFYKIESREGRVGQYNATRLEGFYVQFDDSQKKYVAEIGSGPSIEEIYERFEVEFDRDVSTFELKPMSAR